MPTNTVITYNRVGNREDLQDTIFDVSVNDTPFMDICRKNAKNATAVLHEWQTDELAAAAENAHIEGADATIQISAPTVRLRNSLQIFKKTGAVSGTQEVVVKAGRKSEMAWEIERRGKELAKDMEVAFMSRSPRVEGSETVARKLRGFAHFADKNVSFGAGGASAVSETAALTLGLPRALTRAILDDVLQKIFTKGGNTQILMTSPTLKRAISKLPENLVSVRNNRTGGDFNTIGFSAEMYESDWGLMTIIPNRLMENANADLDLSKTIFAIDPRGVGMATLRPIKKETLAKTGDSERFQLVTEATFAMLSPNAVGVVHDVTA